MPVLHILTSYVYLFLYFLLYSYVIYSINLFFHVTLTIVTIHFLLGYLWLFFPILTPSILGINILNLLIFSLWCFQFYDRLNILLLFLIILNSFSSFYLILYLANRKNTLKLQTVISEYKKIFLYSHLPLVLGLFSFGLIFINDKENLEINSQELKVLLKENLFLEKNFKVKMTLTKDFGFVKKIEFENILLQVFAEKNLCIQNPNFCKSLNYVRFYY